MAFAEVGRQGITRTLAKLKADRAILIHLIQASETWLATDSNPHLHPATVVPLLQQLRREHNPRPSSRRLDSHSLGARTARLVAPRHRGLLIEGARLIVKQHAQSRLIQLLPGSLPQITVVAQALRAPCEGVASLCALIPRGSDKGRFHHMRLVLHKPSQGRNSFLWQQWEPNCCRVSAQERPDLRQLRQILWTDRSIHQAIHNLLAEFHLFMGATDDHLGHSVVRGVLGPAKCLRECFERGHGGPVEARDLESSAPLNFHRNNLRRSHAGSRLESQRPRRQRLRRQHLQHGEGAALLIVFEHHFVSRTKLGTVMHPLPDRRVCPGLPDNILLSRDVSTDGLQFGLCIPLLHLPRPLLPHLR
mmetsp:Transcript_17397/g.41228  ORF Transcript_17397/g.41228 Transcript_17397/m.41228 type:complete len:362 (+) Transcript_17397:2408-3493(+)